MALIAATAAGSRRAASLVTAGAVMTMTTMTMVEEVHQRAQGQQDERQGTHQVRPVLREEEKAGHGDEAEEDPGQRGASL